MTIRKAKPSHNITDRVKPTPNPTLLTKTDAKTEKTIQTAKPARVPIK